LIIYLLEHQIKSKSAIQKLLKNAYTTVKTTPVLMMSLLSSNSGKKGEIIGLSSSLSKGIKNLTAIKSL